MKTYLVQTATPYKRHGDDECNEVRECVARNGFQVGDFNSRKGLLEIDGDLKEGDILTWRDITIRILG